MLDSPASGWWQPDTCWRPWWQQIGWNRCNGKQQSSQWMNPSSPHPKWSRQVRLNLKELVDCFLCQSEDSPQGVHSRPCCKSTVLHTGTKMFEGGCQGKITHTNGMFGTGCDLITCPNIDLHVQHFITENKMAIVPQPVLPQPSSFWFLPIPNDENPNYREDDSRVLWRKLNSRQC